MNDILVRIPDDDLSELASLYEERAPWAPHMVSFVHSQIKWKKSDKYKRVTDFFSPNNCWREDGTIIAVSKLFCQDLFVFTFDDHCTNLSRGLKETKLINFDQRSMFFAIHEKHVQAVKSYLNGKKIDASDSFMYSISPQEVKSFTIECPLDVYLKKLEPSAAKEMDDIWPHKFANSEKYIASYIDLNGGYGVFLKRTSEMVAWTVKYAFGHLGILQTKEEYQKKGYASLVIKALCKEIAEEGHWPVGTMVQNNQSSINMFEKMGFRCIGRCTYIVID